MVIEKLRKGTFQHIESELSAYHETKKEIMRLRNDILDSSPVPDETGVRGSLPGDPTGRKATLLVTHRRLEQLERIVEAIEAVVERLPPEKQELIRLRYWTRPQPLTWYGIGREVGCSRATALRWRNEIISAIAERLGWR